MKNLAIGLLCFCATHLYAQTGNLREGYVITIDGDSIVAMVQQTKNIAEAQQKVMIYDEAKNRKQYVASELSKYYDGQYVRHAIRLNKSWLLLQIQIQGPAKLYNYYYVDKGKTFASTVIHKEGAEPEKFDPYSFALKKQIREYFNDYPPAKWDEFDRGYELTDLQQLVKDYNKWVLAGKPKLSPPKPNQD